MIITALMNCLFLAFTAVSGSHSVKESCSHMNVFLPGITPNPFTFGKGGTPISIYIFAVSII